jgi:hypothetical protein
MEYLTHDTGEDYLRPPTVVCIVLYSTLFRHKILDTLQRTRCHVCGTHGTPNNHNCILAFVYQTIL